MTQNEKDTQKIAELNAVFLRLNDSGKDCALTILKTLCFAQSVMDAESGSQAEGTGRQPLEVGEPQSSPLL